MAVAVTDGFLLLSLWIYTVKDSEQHQRSVNKRSRLLSAESQNINALQPLSQVSVLFCLWQSARAAHGSCSSSCVSVPSFLPLGQQLAQLVKRRSPGCKHKAAVPGVRWDCLNNLSRWIPLGSAFPKAAFEPERQDMGCCWLSAVRWWEKKDEVPRSRRRCGVASGFEAIMSEYLVACIGRHANTGSPCRKS